MPDGTRAAWATTTQKNAAVDGSGNLLLKNLSTPTPTTSAPTTTSATYAVIPEMTTTITTKGNKVLILFSGTIANNTSGALGKVAVFLDGTQVSPDFQWTAAGTGFGAEVCISWLDSPSAASHTYDIRWKSNGAANMTATLLLRTLQVVELG